MKIRFYKDPDTRWYADLPDYMKCGGKKEDCEMVAGADRWLNVLSRGESEITLDISKEGGEHVLRLAHLGFEASKEDFMEYGGATYRPGSPIDDVDYSHTTLWLCSVTLFVMGEYPMAIYYTVSSGPTDPIL